MQHALLLSHTGKRKTEMARHVSALFPVYMDAVYTIPELQINLFPGKHSQQLTAFLQKENEQSASFITAHNPYSLRQAGHFNEYRNTMLEYDLLNAGYTYYIGYGKDKKGLWEAEESFLVLGIPLMRTHYLCRRYAQNAFLYAERDTPVSLFFTGQYIPYTS